MANVGKAIFVWIPEELHKKLKIKLIKENKSLKNILINFFELYTKDIDLEKKEKRIRKDSKSIKKTE